MKFKLQNGIRHTAYKKRMTGRQSKENVEKALNVWDAASRGNIALIKSWCAHLRALHFGGIRHTLVSANGLPRHRNVVKTKSHKSNRLGSRGKIRHRAADVVSVADWPRYADCCDIWTGWTPLMLAVANNHKEIVQVLLAAGASPVKTSEDSNGMTALHIACNQGRLGVVKMLIKVSPKGTYVKNNHRKTCLHAACEANRIGIVRWLLDKDDSEDHSLVSVIADNEMYEEVVTDTIEAHRKTHKDLVFMIRAKKMRASLGF